MKGHYLLPLLVFVVILLNNCATTTRLKTETDYRPVSPSKTRLICSYTLPKEKISPIITVKLIEERLAVRVQTDYYKTSYAWLNRTSCLGLSGLSILAAINWWDEYGGPDTARVYYGRVFGILGAAIFLVGAIRGEDPWHPKEWQKEQIFNQDTSYRFPSPVTVKMIQVKPYQGGERKSFSTDITGNFELDIRDFYDISPPDSDFILEISSTNLAGSIRIPKDYVKKVKTYEEEAKVIFKQAQVKELDIQYFDALSIYDKIISEYPYSSAVPKAKERKAELEKKIRETKITQIRNQLQSVSEGKVINVIEKLGLTEYESNEFGWRIENLSFSTAVAVMKNGLGLPLNDAECEQEYKNLSRYQKFYAILCYKDYLGEAAIEELSSIFDISNTTAEKLVNINPKSLLMK